MKRGGGRVQRRGFTVRTVLALLAIAPLLVVAAPAAHGEGYVLESFTQTYQVAAQGVITVVCPDPATPPLSLVSAQPDPSDPGNSTVTTPWVSDCVPMGGMPGAPPDKQLWFGGVGIDIPADAKAQSVIVQDATGTATPAGVCIDHNMNNLCGPSDPQQDPSMPETAVFFCGRFDGMASVPDFQPMPGMMMKQHIDVWVRNAGGIGWPTDQLGLTSYGAPLCGGDVAGLPNSGPLGVGTRGTVTITALVPS
jgi:hypothetical protein